MLRSEHACWAGVRYNVRIWVAYVFEKPRSKARRRRFPQSASVAAVHFTNTERDIDMHDQPSQPPRIEVSWIRYYHHELGCH